MSAITNLTSSRISLPLVGSVSVVVAAGAALGIYFLFFRRGRVTSKTVTTRYRR
jgi:hypothetical protein